MVNKATDMGKRCGNGCEHAEHALNMSGMFYTCQAGSLHVGLVVSMPSSISGFPIVSNKTRFHGYESLPPVGNRGCRPTFPEAVLHVEKLLPRSKCLPRRFPFVRIKISEVRLGLTHIWEESTYPLEANYVPGGSSTAAWRGRIGDYQEATNTGSLYGDPLSIASMGVRKEKSVLRR
ncbi:hypothetical protein HOY80DRAFT_1134032 [Tuber brumale]|nr:hypothetical protein HOY80DRAFT_1134032 [Tuber brumale]